jgi:hypothetical protein
VVLLFGTRRIACVSFQGPSRWLAPGLAPGEEQRLFGDAWDIEPIEVRPGPTAFAAFIMTRRQITAVSGRAA